MVSDFTALRKEIVERFEKNIKAHLDKDVDYIVDDLGEGFFTMSEGEVSYPTKGSERKRFTEYLNCTIFREYRSIEEPVINFSDDGSVAWGRFKVKVSGVQGDSEFTLVCAWLWLYRRVDDKWVRIGEVSTWR